MMTASDLMTRNVLTVGPEMPVSEIAEIILEHKVTSLPVVDDEGSLVGVVSEGDLVRCSRSNRDAHRSWWLVLLTKPAGDHGDILSQPGRTVQDVMSKSVLFATEQEPLSRLVELLSRRRIKRLPIVKNGKLVGIVSRVDILRHLAKESHLLDRPRQAA